MDDDQNEQNDQGEVREAMVERLLRGYREQQSSSAFADFLGVEFASDPPTDAERAEAHRRYVDETAEKGLPDT